MSILCKSPLQGFIQNQEKESSETDLIKMQLVIKQVTKLLQKSKIVHYILNTST